MEYFRYHNTNCFFLSGESGKVMAFDAGWPCTLQEYRRMMKSIGLRYENIAWSIISHMHMDHAGLLSEFQNFGIECFLFDGQFEGIDEMERIILKNAEYRDYRKIDKMGFTRTTVQAFNRFCQEIKVFGQVIKTPGHSPDSITYITKDREALIGDLYPKNQIMPDDAASLASWALIESKGAQKAFPSHAAVFDLEATG